MVKPQVITITVSPMVYEILVENKQKTGSSIQFQVNKILSSSLLRKKTVAKSV